MTFMVITKKNPLFQLQPLVVEKAIRSQRYITISVPLLNSTNPVYVDVTRTIPKNVKQDETKKITKRQQAVL